MQIIISCAKTMIERTNLQVPPMSHPRFIAEAHTIAGEMARWSAQDVARALRCNTQIAAQTLLRYQGIVAHAGGAASLSGYGMPAALAYHGQVFKHLKAETFSAGQQQYANEHLWICSFLYGLLRPFDTIMPYRLEGSVRLQITDGKTLFDYWRTRLTSALIDSVKADDGILVFLAAEEMKRLFDWRRVQEELTVVQPLFYEDDGSRLKTVVVRAKSCRGAMTRYILLNRPCSIEELHGFELDGYRYRPNYGEELFPHFIKG